MEITTFQRASACIGMSTFGLARMGSVVPNLAAVSVKPRHYGDAGNGGLGALDAWGPPV
jgi:hypothetical protein